MGHCPSCDRQVDQLHPLPPAVITRDLLAAFDHLDTPTEIELCGPCVTGLT